MKYEKTLIILKPGVLERGLVGEIIGRIERKGLDILALKTLAPSKTLFAELYKEHKTQKFYQDLMSCMTNSYSIVLVVGGIDAVIHCRNLSGATNPVEAASGTIRGDFGLRMPENIIHASDSTSSATREIKIFFKNSEIRKL